MRRHPLIALLHTTPRYRWVTAAFALRCTGVYGAQFLAVWGAWHRDSPDRAAAVVVATCLAGAVAAHWTGHLTDREGSWRVWLRAAGVVEAVAAAVLAWSGLYELGFGVVVTASALAGVTGSVMGTAVAPIARASAAPHHGVGVLGVGVMFDIGKLAGVVLLAVAVAVPAAVVCFPLAVLAGVWTFASVGVTHAGAVPSPPDTGPSSSPADAGPPGHTLPTSIAGPLVVLGTVMAVIGQSSLITASVTPTAARYVAVGVAWTFGAIVSTLMLTARRFPTGRATLVVSATLFALSVPAMVAVPAAAVPVVGLVYGWGFATTYQLCRLWLLDSAGTRPGRASGLSVAIVTVTNAAGAPLTAAVLPHPGPTAAVAVLSGLVAVAAVVAPRRRLPGTSAAAVQQDPAPAS